MAEEIREKNVSETAPIEGFVYAGCWSPPETKLNKDRSLVRHEPGLYAFVCGDKLVYVGKAENLRGRLRGYNRSLTPPTTRKWRPVHAAIRKAWESGKTIAVWIRPLPGSDDQSRREAESALIRGRDPEWNCAGKDRPRD